MIDRAPHYLLDGLTGWRVATLQNAAVTSHGLGLDRVPGSVRPLTDPAGTFGGLQDPAGVALDREDRVYILDSKANKVRRYDPCTCRFVELPCVGGKGSEPRRLDSPNGIAISCRDWLYIVDSGNRRVQVFSVHGLTLRAIWGPLAFQKDGTRSSAKHSEGTWHPWDITISSKDWAYVSDYANGLIHVFDPTGCWRKAYAGFVKPTRITLDRDGHLYVIQEGLNFVTVLDSSGAVLGTISQPADVKGAFCPAAVAVDVNGNLCLSDRITQKVYFYQSNGDGAWCRGSVSASAEALIFDRSGKPLLAGACGVCEVQPIGGYSPAGVYFSAALDSKTYRCVWDRVWMHGVVPAGSSIRVDTFTAEAQKTPDEIAKLPEGRWSTGQVHAATASKDWDCLILGAPGRYLWLRLTFASDGSAGPEIHRLKVYYPRSSSLKYLPAVYRADVTSGDFLDRFCTLFDVLRRTNDGIITDIARYFDPSATPPDFLAWLAQWLGMALKNGWPLERRRALLKNAHRLYALRGTPAGLKLHIMLYTGVEPRILELFRLRRWLSLDQSTLGNDSTISDNSPMNRLQIGTNSSIGSFQLIDYGDPKLDLFTKYAYQFLVVVPRWSGAGAADQQSVEQIIELAKPAHTVAQFQWAEPRLRIGLQSYVGVDTVIGKYPVGVIEGQGKLGYDTVLGRPGENRRDQELRVGEDSVLM